MKFLGQFRPFGRWRRNTFGDRIVIEDEIRVYEGTKLKFKSKGHIVNQGLICMVNMMSCLDIDSAPNSLPSYGYDTLTGNSFMRVGTGAVATGGATTDLTAPDATAPDSQGGIVSNPGGGQYRIAWTATWNAGSIAALTVTELGLYLAMSNTIALLGFGASIVGALQTAEFFSRLSEADGDFVAFVINIGAPLTIEWRLTFSFA